MKRCGLFLIMLIFSGCATDIPLAIRSPPLTDPAVSDVQSSDDRFAGATVRWGGVITQVENKENSTWVEVVSRRLSKNGKPTDNDWSAGRFIAKFEEFIDPTIFTAGRSVTVAGTVEGHIERPIGEFIYRFPIVTVTSSYLWPSDPNIIIYDDSSYWYDDPWRPFFYPYPYRHPRNRH